MNGEIPEAGQSEPIERLTASLADDRRERLKNIENAEEVFPGGWRLTYTGAKLNVPETWVIFDGQGGALVVDAGGELPVETAADKRSLRGIARVVTGMSKTPKLNALRELLDAYGAKITADLRTHADVDHGNLAPYLEKLSIPDAPIFVAGGHHKLIASPQDQFDHARAEMERLRITGNNPGELILRQRLFQLASVVINNPLHNPWSDEDAERRRDEVNKRIQDYPERFPLADESLEVLRLPGHAPEEVGFYKPEQKIIIVGDLLTTSKTERATRLNLFLPDANIYQALESIHRLQELDIEQLYVAHGPPVIGKQRIQEYLSDVVSEAQTIIDRTNALHRQHPTLTTAQLSTLVFSKGWQRKGMIEREQETWVLSILRDRPAAEDAGQK